MVPSQKCDYRKTTGLSLAQSSDNDIKLSIIVSNQIENICTDIIEEFSHIRYYSPIQRSTERTPMHHTFVPPKRDSSQRTKIDLADAKLSSS